ncbi:uncharacterized protein LOC131213447 [Anopheles bellator]|uniref:uncharacterized protein LOC131213447 n=1 Tax=Anopheles bellator TaxID=139047 RepID=UPI002648274C|nr:uncharacterized protein LOC131213447 [Anopheles bellator]
MPPHLVQGEVEQSYEMQCAQWMEQLNPPRSLPAVISVCQDIFISHRCRKPAPAAAAGITVQKGRTQLLQYGKNSAGNLPSSSNQKLIELLASLFADERIPYPTQKIICKSYFRLCYYNNLRHAMVPFNEATAFDGKTAAERSIIIWGMLGSDFTSLFENNSKLCRRLPERNLELLVSSAGYTRWYNTVVENILNFDRLNFSVANCHHSPDQVWHAVLANLESPYYGTREHMFALLKHLLKVRAFALSNVLPLVGRWSWLNRNKFHLLVLLLGQFSLEALLPQLSVAMSELADVLKLSLNYKHLMRGGQTLVRTLLREDRPFVYNVIVELWRTANIDLCRNMVKHWGGCLLPTDLAKIYLQMELDRLELNSNDSDEALNSLPDFLQSAYEKLYLVAKVFRRQFETHSNLHGLLVLLCKLIEQAKPSSLSYGLLFETLAHHISVGWGKPQHVIEADDNECVVWLPFAMTKLSQFALDVINTSIDSNLCTTVVKEFRQLLHQVPATIAVTSTVGRHTQLILARFMSFEMYNNFLLTSSPKLNLYHPTLTALQMYSAFVELFFEFRPTSPYQMVSRPHRNIGWIAPLLPEPLTLDSFGSSYRSVIYTLQYLLRSEFEDVQRATLKLLYNKSTAYHFQTGLLGRLALRYSGDQSSPDIGQAWLASLSEDLVTIEYDLTIAFHTHENDYYAAAVVDAAKTPERQLYRVLDRANETFFGFEQARPLLQRIEGFERILHLAVNVINLSVEKLNVAKQQIAGEEAEAEVRAAVEGEAAAEAGAEAGEEAGAEAGVGAGVGAGAEAEAKEQAGGEVGVEAGTEAGAEAAAEEPAVDGTNFDIMDRSLQMLLETSAKWPVEIPEGDSVAAVKAKRALQAALWKSLRSAALFIKNFAIWLIDHYQERQEALETMTLCLDVLINSMLNCCHRAAIENIGNSLGLLVRHVTQLKSKEMATDELPSNIAEDLSQHNRHFHPNVIVQLFERKFWTCLELHTRMEQYELRRHRGYLWLVWNFIRNDVDGNVYGSFLRMYFEEHVKLRELATAYYESLDIEPVSQLSVLQLHQLKLLVQDASLNGTILEYANELLIVALVSIRSNHWVVRNAANGLFTQLVTKLTGHRQQCFDHQCAWLPKYVSLDELCLKLHHSMSFMIRVLQENQEWSLHIIPVLVLLSKLEFRAYGIPMQQQTVNNIRLALWELLCHRHSLVRQLAAESFANVHDHTELPAMWEQLVITLFTTKSDDNFRHGLCLALGNTVRKYFTYARYLPQNDDSDVMQQTAATGIKTTTLLRVRSLVRKYYQHDAVHNPKSTYHYRCAMLEFLLFLGFGSKDDVILQLVLNKIAPNMHGVEVFLLHTSKLYNGNQTKFQMEMSHSDDSHESIASLPVEILPESEEEEV